MRLFVNSRNLTRPVGPFAVGIGIFDGVHRGHQALLTRVVELARADELGSLVFTFDPHPAKVLAPTRAPQLLEPLESRVERFAALGLGAVLVERFDRELADTPAAEFVAQTVVGKLQARHVVVGAGFTFGAGGSGTTASLTELGATHGFSTHVVPPVVADGQVISSTRIRALVRDGEVAAAAELLGRPFTLVGLVMRGAMRGQKLGFPTANLAAANELWPARGVYAGIATGVFGEYGAVINVGVAPTFGVDALKIEAHLLDFPFAPLYGQQMSVQLCARLRDEQRFPDVEALCTQIGLDRDRARALLAARRGP